MKNNIKPPIWGLFILPIGAEIGDGLFWNQLSYGWLLRS